MIRQKNLFNSRVRNAGRIGGWHCPCCAPAPSHRKAVIRQLKRGKWKRLLDKLVREDQ